jgi:hypothetical protein
MVCIHVMPSLQFAHTFTVHPSSHAKPHLVVAEPFEAQGLALEDLGQFHDARMR